MRRGGKRQPTTVATVMMCDNALSQLPGHQLASFPSVSTPTGCPSRPQGVSPGPPAFVLVKKREGTKEESDETTNFGVSGNMGCFEANQLCFAVETIGKWVKYYPPDPPLTRLWLEQPPTLYLVLVHQNHEFHEISSCFPFFPGFCHSIVAKRWRTTTPSSQTPLILTPTPYLELNHCFCAFRKSAPGLGRLAISPCSIVPKQCEKSYYTS